MSFYTNPDALQTFPSKYWEPGRIVDMNAFDTLPREVRNWLNEKPNYFPVEDILYEHVNVLNGNAEATVEWLDSLILI